jgi:hypothetical protein
VTGVYTHASRRPAATDLALDGVVTGGTDGACLGTVQGGVFKRTVVPSFQYRQRLPDAAQLAECATLVELLALLGNPTSPFLEQWCGDRQNAVHGWSLFAFDADGGDGVGLLHVMALVSRGAGEEKWRVDGLLIRQGAAAPADSAPSGLKRLGNSERLPR